MIRHIGEVEGKVEEPRGDRGKIPINSYVGGGVALFGKNGKVVVPSLKGVPRRGRCWDTRFQKRRVRIDKGQVLIGLIGSKIYQ